MIRIVDGNDFTTGTEDIAFLTFSLPSRITCPYSTHLCRQKCFAKKNENFKNVVDSRQDNLTETMKDAFAQNMISSIKTIMDNKKYQNKEIYFRIHPSGDFYSKEYLLKWVDVTESLSDIKSLHFQCYTKSIRYFKEIKDMNCKVVYSRWSDTDPEDTKVAEELGYSIYIASPKDEIKDWVDKGAFLCDKNSDFCMECYTGKSQLIVAPYL